MNNTIYVIINSCDDGDDPGCVGGWFNNAEDALAYAKTDADIWYEDHHDDEDDDDESPEVNEDTLEVRCLIGNTTHLWSVQRVDQHK